MPAYERDPYLRELDAHVVAVGVDGERPYAVLDDTVLFAAGGGQPADHGRLVTASAQVDVLDVQRATGQGSEIRHYLSAPVASGDRGTLRLDWSRRYDLMQQHTAQHLLTAVALERHGWATTSFHLGDLGDLAVCDVELDVQSLGARQLDELEEAVQAEVRAARQVTARRIPHADYLALGERVRSRGLPEGFHGDVRLIEIAGIDLNTCGGTHLRSTAEIESIKLLSTEKLRGGTRVHFVAGGRVRRRLGAREAQAADLRALLGASDQDLVELAKLKTGKLEEADRRCRALGKELAAATAKALLVDSENVTARHFPDQDAAFVQEVARAWSAAAGRRIALLTAGAGDRLAFVLATGSDSLSDARVLGPRIAELLEGRGGGSARVFQGKAGSLARLDDAIALLSALP